MKLAENLNSVSTGSVLSSGEFGIAKNAKMFRILSDSMYKDKIGSMVRELCSNARDAHVDNGCGELSYVVHLPDAMEPWFSVSDSGKGINEVDIYKVLCVYGESTKDQSNDAIGAFGLGAKTPFAYTDNFTVISCNGGKKRMYSAATDGSNAVIVDGTEMYGTCSSGLPVLNLQSETDTNDSGFTVMVSVAGSDFSQFRRKLITQLQFFPVKPIVENCEGFEWKVLTADIVYESDLVTMYNGTYENPVSGLWLSQGGVGYPVDIEELQGMSREDVIFARALHKQNAYMKFEIGEIDVTAPRENVSYDPATIKNIIDRIVSISKIIRRDVLGRIMKAKTLWERCEIFNEQIEIVKKSIKSVSIFDKLFLGADIYNKVLSISFDKLEKADFRAVKYYHKKNKSYSYGVSRILPTDMIPSDNIKILIRDTTKKPVARVKHMLTKSKNDKLEFIIIDSLKCDVKVTANDIPAIAVALGVSEDMIGLVSELEAPPVLNGGGGRSKTPTAFMYKGSDTYDSKNWERQYEHIDELEDCIWVEMDRHDIEYDVDLGLISDAIQKHYISHRLIAVNSKTAKRIRDGKIGADLLTVGKVAKTIRDRIGNMVSGFSKYQRDKSFIRQINRDTIAMTLIANITDMPLSKRFASMVEKNKLLSRKYNDMDWALYYMGDGVERMRKHGTTQAEIAIEAIKAKHPMLKYIGTHYGNELEGTELEDAMEYINRDSA